MANTYDVGQRVRLTCTFTVSDVATDPTTITLEVEPPGDSVSTYTYAASQITRSAQGVYYKDLDLDEEGIWNYTWTGTGNVVAAAQGYFIVREKRTG